MDIFPATSSNQITAEYYFCLVGQINRGTCSKKVQKITRRNGSHTYETYHLISEK
jgi:hypothetical protein